MKLFKRINALTLTVIMVVMLLGTSTAFAAEPVAEGTVFAEPQVIDVVENEDGSREITLEFTPSAEQTDIGISPYSSVFLDQTFSMTGSHTGSTRTYNANSVQLSVYMTKTNGERLTDGTVLEVRFKEASTNTPIHAFQTSSYNTTTGFFPITYGGRYYMQYVIAYGTQSVRIRMVVRIQ